MLTTQCTRADTDVGSSSAAKRHMHGSESRTSTLIFCMRSAKSCIVFFNGKTRNKMSVASDTSDYNMNVV